MEYGLETLMLTLNITGYDPTVLAERLRRAGYPDLAKQVEAQTKPLLPEPGLWGVVQSSSGATFVRADGGIWRSTDDGISRMWEDIDSPTLVREGVEL